MLDQISGGRLEIGFGRGASLIELAFYSDPDAAQEIYSEGLELILKGLTVKVFFSMQGPPGLMHVRMMLEPLQKPYPPIWYGVHAPGPASVGRSAIFMLSASIRRPKRGCRWSATARRGGRRIRAPRCQSSASAVYRGRRDRRQGARAGAARLSGLAPSFTICSACATSPR